MTAAFMAWALAYAGFCALCFAMDRHHEQAWGRPTVRRTAAVLRIAGFGLLVLALVPCAAGLEGSTGVVLWFGVLTAAALPLIFLLSYAPRLAVAFGWMLPLAAAVVTAS